MGSRDDAQEVALFSHILVPLDESRLAERVLPHVTVLAALAGAKVTLLNVLEPPSSAGVAQPTEPVEWQLGLERVRSYLAGVRERLQRAGLRAESEIVEGNPPTSILEFAKRNDVDLLALTSHGAGGGEAHSLGEIALKCLIGAKTSVLLVRSFSPLLPVATATEGGGEAPGYRCLVVPLDCSLRAEVALPYAERLCNASGGCLHVVHVLRPGPQWPAGVAGNDPERQRQAADEALQRARAYIDGVVSGASGPHRQLMGAVVEANDVVGSLDSLAFREEVDLLVMSAHGASGGTRTPYGAVTLDLLVYGYAPVLVVQDRAANELLESHAERAAKERQGHG